MIRNLNFPLPPTYWTGEQIKPGDWVKSYVRTFGGIWHHGIIRGVLWNGECYCVEVIHNVKNGGVIVSSLEEFAEGPVVLVGRPSSPEHREAILATGDANLGKPYYLFSQNCEHFCTFCYTWQPKSESIDGIVKFAALTAGVVALVRFAGNSD
jgi:hypothetical protein